MSTGPGANTAAVTVIKPDPSILTALSIAFDAYEMFPAGCAETIADTVHVAKINDGGEMWAVAGFKPAPNCVQKHVRAFGEIPPPPVGAFSGAAYGGEWHMTTEVGKPFPCPPTPGQGAVIPEEVLKAWQIPYFFPGCLPFIPRPPA